MLHSQAAVPVRTICYLWRRSRVRVHRVANLQDFARAEAPGRAFPAQVSHGSVLRSVQDRCFMPRHSRYYGANATSIFTFPFSKGYARHIRTSGSVPYWPYAQGTPRPCESRRIGRGCLPVKAADRSYGEFTSLSDGRPESSGGSG